MYVWIYDTYDLQIIILKNFLNSLFFLSFKFFSAVLRMFQSLFKGISSVILWGYKDILKVNLDGFYRCCEDSTSTINQGYFKRIPNFNRSVSSLTTPKCELQDVSVYTLYF